MKIQEFKDKKILVVGFGVEGKATLAYLKHFYPDKEIGIADAKSGPDYLQKMTDYDVVIKTAGIPRRLIHIPCTTATNIFFANTKGMVVGVTGSKGKSTTASLIYAILKESGMKVKLLGNIGIPMLGELRGQNDSDCVYVVELSSYQLEDVEYSPHISVFTTFFPDHMDYHGGLEEYWQAKRNIVMKAKKNDYFVFNPQVKRLQELAKETAAQPIPFVEKFPFPHSAMPLLGEHNMDNTRAAITVARLLSIRDEIIEKAIRSFKGLPHRLECVGEFRGVRFYDDAISTTPESTLAALKSLQNVKMLFLGGTDRGYDFTTLAREVVALGVERVVLFPESGTKIKDAIKDAAQNLEKKAPHFFETDDMKKAVEYAYEHALNRSVCLLSTASPSYSLWKNYEEKGDLFIRHVQELGLLFTNR